MSRINRSLHLIAFSAIALLILSSKSWGNDLPAGQDVPFVDGSMAITGMVITEGGEPVVGIEVVATARRLYGKQTDVFDLGEGRPERTARTDTNGRFLFQGLADGDYEIRTVASDSYPLVKSAVIRIRPS